MSKDRKPSKTDINRARLIQKSKEAREVGELLLTQAGVELEDGSTNEVLIALYKLETGAEEFRTFMDWKKAGYRVKKGEKAFLIWGQPIKAKKASEGEESANQEGEESGEAKKYKYWPLCYLFGDHQVEPMGDGPEGDKPKREEAPAERAQDRVTETETQDIAAHQLEGDTIYCVQEETIATESEIIGSPFVDPDYAERQEARKDRLIERAEAAGRASEQRYRRARSMASAIPFGQPILIGHHSEKRDRNYRERIVSNYRKSFELDNKAEYLERRASSVGTGGISSNDPEAIQKLREKLAGLEEAQETMKAANKALRKGDDSALYELGLTEAQIQEIKVPQFGGRVGFAPYQLQNNNAEIRRVKARIDELTNLYQADPIDFEGDDFSMCVEAGRVCVTFHGGKPSEEARQLLKRSYAFKYSRRFNQWTRKATANGLGAAKQLQKQLLALDGLY